MSGDLCSDRLRPTLGPSILLWSGLCVIQRSPLVRSELLLFLLGGIGRRFVSTTVEGLVRAETGPYRTSIRML